jgi:hypothetical protein
MTSKADYVRLQPQTRPHTCHWPGCDTQVPPAMWGCIPHWYSLPANLRAAIWRVYVPGQEVTLTPSRAYLEVARQAEAWIAQHLQNRKAKAAAAPPRRVPAQPDLFGSPAPGS